MTGLRRWTGVPMAHTDYVTPRRRPLALPMLVAVFATLLGLLGPRQRRTRDS